MSKEINKESIVNKLLLVIVTVLITAAVTYGIQQLRANGGSEFRFSNLEDIVAGHLVESKQAMTEFSDVKQKQAVMLENLSYMKNDIGELKTDIREIKKLMQKSFR